MELLGGPTQSLLLSSPRKRGPITTVSGIWVPACAGTTVFIWLGFSHPPGRGKIALLSRTRNQFIAAAGRSFFTSASGGSTLAPSTYLKSDMVPLPSLSAILPT